MKKDFVRLRVLVSELQEFYLLSLHGFLGLLRRPFYLKDAIYQMDYTGAGSVLIVLLISLFIGMALALQLATELLSLGFKMYIGKIVGISILREVGPVLTGLVFAGRVGSGFASELGSMILGHQIDTLRAFGVDPIKKLVTPRILSSVVMLPALTIIGDAVAILGAYYVAVHVSQQSSSVYWSSVRGVFVLENVVVGSVKPFVFGYIVACVSCYMGLTTKGGATGLRRSTTKAVVGSFVLIILSDFLMTRILLSLLGFSL